jgi:hypothetical protein
MKPESQQQTPNPVQIKGLELLPLKLTSQGGQEEGDEEEEEEGGCLTDDQRSVDDRQHAILTEVLSNWKVGLSEILGKDSELDVGDLLSLSGVCIPQHRPIPAPSPTP